jgi:hypothetical protein
VDPAKLPELAANERWIGGTFALPELERAIDLDSPDARFPDVIGGSPWQEEEDENRITDGSLYTYGIFSSPLW